MFRDTHVGDIEWSFCRVDKKSGQAVGDQMPARVPGDVFTDLMNAGRIPDPYIGLNSKEVQWVDDWDWLYFGRCRVPGAEGRRTFLQFMGVDYRSAVRFNGKELCRHVGMFSRILHEVSDLVAERNLIEVKMEGIPDTRLTRYIPPMIINSELARRGSLKDGVSYGWDFAPKLKGCGIWDEVSLYRTGPVMIEDVCVRAGISGEVEVLILLDSNAECEPVLKLSIIKDGRDVAGQRTPVNLKPGRKPVLLKLNVPDPRLWWPWDLGQPELYGLALKVMVNDRESDAVSESFGFREIGWERNPDAPAWALPWVLTVNGKREFMRGASWVPLDSMPGRRGDEAYVKLLDMAKECGMNIIRMHGGGKRERAAFYEHCDRMGMLVWQEYPTACLSLFGLPRNERYLKLLKQECTEITRQLRNHPCLMMWCGGNENNMRYSQPAKKVMEQAAAENDPTRRFVPNSPYRGDVHNWLVWHMYGNLEDYFSDTSQLISEFGLQGVPSLKSLKKFIPDKDLWPISRVWLHHNIGKAKMDKYVKYFGGGSDLDGYIEGSQRAQAYYLKMGIEHWRRRKYRTSGTMIWQLNEPWPSICWSIIDYFFESKLSFEHLKDSYGPILITCAFKPGKYQAGNTLHAGVYIVNDLPQAFQGLEVEVAVTGQSLSTFSVNVEPDSVTLVKEINVELPANNPPVLELYLRQTGSNGPSRLIAENRYMLTYHDPAPARKSAKTIFRLLWKRMEDYKTT